MGIWAEPDTFVVMSRGMQEASLTANASTMRWDEKAVWIEEPLEISVESEVEKIQARPAILWSLFQAASVWQIMASVVGDGGMQGIFLVQFGLGMIDWALSHSLQEVIALLTICCCVRVLESKISWFQLSQKLQQIHEKMLEIISTSGRLIRRVELRSSS